MVPSTSAVQSGPVGHGSVLYICYLGITEPLVETQVIPYLVGLAAAGYSVLLLTFEPYPLSEDEQRSCRAGLQRHNIEWHTLRYHKRPALPATLADMITGIGYAAYIICRRAVGIVHARGHVPAAMAVVLKWLLRTRFVFDVRGLMADEYVDAGLWKAKGVLYRLTKRMEAIFLANADAVVVLTRRARAWLIESGRFKGRVPPVETIPCCVDLQRFRIDRKHAQRLRKSLGFDGHIVMVYAGKLGGWYMTREMVDFFTAAKRHLPGLRFLVLTQSDFSLMEEAFASRDVDGDSYRCLRVLPNDLAVYLDLADFAISFIKPSFSKIASSPTKMAEYLAAGLPIVYNTGIGDLDELESEEIGILVKSFAHGDYVEAAQRVRALLDDREPAASRCRTVAQKYFSLSTVGIPRYLRLYSTLMELPALGAERGHVSYVAHVGTPVDDEAEPSHTA